jgi:serine/threonine protein kinase/HAMP domain-containing protein
MTGPTDSAADPDATRVVAHDPDATRVVARDPDATRVAVPDPDATRLVAPDADATRVFDPEATRLRRRTRLLGAAKTDRSDATVVRTRLLAPGEAPPPAEPALPTAALALQPGFRLHEYRIDGVLGQGGFGITYAATDVHLDTGVAIKEYLPEEIAFRAGDRSVSPNASRHRDRYRAGLESFLVEARTLASLRHPAIVRVARFFEAHRTAYMVMELERGEPFKTWWPQHRGIGEKGLIDLVLPLLDGLAAVHAAGFLHRDIKPDNIQVRKADGSLVLLDFGSAGQVVALAEPGAVVLTLGYAPIEQYGLGQQGAWTDLYALGATLYWAVAGKKPPDAEWRAASPSSYVPAVQVGQGRFGEAFLKAIDWALLTDASQRPQDVASFRRALCADHLASLGLREALIERHKEHDTQPDSEHDAPMARREQPRQRWARRARRGLALVVSPRDWPLAFKLGLAMLATALLPMLVTGLYNLRGAQAAMADAELRFVQQMARGTAERLSQFVRDAQQQAQALASDPAWAALLARPDEPGAAAAINTKLQRLVRADPDAKALLLLDTYGQAPAASEASLIGRDFSFQRPFQDVIAGRANVSGLVVLQGADGADLFVAAPVRGEGDTLAGVLVLQLAGASLAKILDDVRADPRLTPFLVDGDGVLVHHPNAALRYSSLVPLPEKTLAEIRADQRFGRDEIPSLNETQLAAALRGAAATGHTSYRSAVSGRDEIAGFAPVPGLNWTVGVSEPRTVFEAPLDTLGQHLWWSVGLVGLLFTGLALRFARSIVRPVLALTEAANALKAGQYAAAAVPVKSRDEVGQLARTFNVMIDVLRQRERERRHG